MTRWLDTSFPLEAVSKYRHTFTVTVEGTEHACSFSFSDTTLFRAVGASRGWEPCQVPRGTRLALASEWPSLPLRIILAPTAPLVPDGYERRRPEESVLYQTICSLPWSLRALLGYDKRLCAGPLRPGPALACQRG